MSKKNLVLILFGAFGFNLACNPHSGHTASLEPKQTVRTPPASPTPAPVPKPQGEPSGLNGCWAGKSVKYGSLGSYLGACPVKLLVRSENWAAGLYLEWLEFDCRFDSGLRLGKINFSVHDGIASDSGVKGTISKNQLIFDFPLSHYTDHVEIVREENSIEIQASEFNGQETYRGRLSPCSP